MRLSRSLFFVRSRVLLTSTCSALLARRSTSCEQSQHELRFQFRPPSKQDLVWTATITDHLFRKAIKENDLKVAQYLLFVDFRLNVEVYFNEACGSGSLEIAKYLLAAHPDACNVYEAFRRVCLYSDVFDPSVAEWLMEKGASWTSLRNPKTYEYQIG